MRYQILATFFVLLLSAMVDVEGQVKYEGPLRAMLVRAQKIELGGASSKWQSGDASRSPFLVLPAALTLACSS
jgi:hypothetical protein